MDSDDNNSDTNQQQDENRSTADIISSFILHAPPGEVNEVLNDIKAIVKDEEVVSEQVSKVLPKYNKKQMISVKLDDCEHPVILSNHNDLGTNRFADPRSKRSFLFDHLTGTISDLQAWQPEPVAEPWRVALENDWTKYTLEHYHEGAGSVFSTHDNNLITLNACLEGHQYQPKKFWNGRWRSTWTISFKPNEDKQVELQGTIRLHVHYYEDGNVQLVDSRNCDHKIDINKPEQVAKDIVDVVRRFENESQRAISENYQTMSDTTFKALRRPLPIIRSKIEWNKLKGYKIASELKQQ